MVVQHVMVIVAILQQLALHQHYGAMAMVFVVMVGERMLLGRHRAFGCMIGVPLLRIDNYLNVT